MTNGETGALKNGQECRKSTQEKEARERRGAQGGKVYRESSVTCIHIFAHAPALSVSAQSQAGKHSGAAAPRHAG